MLEKDGKNHIFFCYIFVRLYQSIETFSHSIVGRLVFNIDQAIIIVTYHSKFSEILQQHRIRNAISMFFNKI